MNKSILNSISQFLKLCHEFLESKNTDALEELIYKFNNDAEDFANFLISENLMQSNPDHVLYSEALEYFIEVCSYVENEMSIPALISDELYDKLVEKLINLNGKHVIGSPTSEATERSHMYPELRGSLSKIHFIWDKDIPKGDTRKSLEGWLRNVLHGVTPNIESYPYIHIMVAPKLDGVSHILEIENQEIKRVLTRGDVVNNLGKDLTPLFAKMFPDGKGGINTNKMAASMGLMWVGLESNRPSLYPDDKFDFGLKVETFMLTQDFERYKKEFNIKRCNRRSAVTSICNKIASSVSEKEAAYLALFLRMQPLQISTERHTISQPEHGFPPYNYYDGIQVWKVITSVNGRDQIFNQDIIFCNEDYAEIGVNINEGISLLADKISKMKEMLMIQYSQYPVDGIVLTIVDDEIAGILGRHDDKNSFQIAFKFPAGEAITVVEGVDFQVGPVAGRITPVAKLRPIEINGNTISNVTVSNKTKLERLNLHIGDEVLIKYDIIPTIFKTPECKEQSTGLIEFPKTCPICGGDVEDEVCTNPDCPAKLLGHIVNFVKKVDIKGGLGIETIETLINAGLLKSIGDLYRLFQHKEEMAKIPNLGETSIQNILDGIKNARKLLPHQILGSIGIPNIGRRIMEKVCKEFDIFGNLFELSYKKNELCQINGIGLKIAQMIIDGISAKRDVIKDICNNVEILEYPTPTKSNNVKVCFTMVRDDDFEEYLKSQGIEVVDSLTKSVNYLIVSDIAKPSSKTSKAKLWEIPLLGISEAKEKWGYGK